jgi:hypothetical protein
VQVPSGTFQRKRGSQKKKILTSQDMSHVVTRHDACYAKFVFLLFLRENAKFVVARQLVDVCFES